MKTIFLADSNNHVRAALRLQIEIRPALEVAGEADHVESLLVQVCQHPPDVILLDWNLPGIHHQRLIMTLREHCPNTRLIGTGIRTAEEKLTQDYQLDGFLSQRLPPEKFMTALIRLISEE